MTLAEKYLAELTCPSARRPAEQPQYSDMSGGYDDGSGYGNGGLAQMRAAPYGPQPLPGGGGAVYGGGMRPANYSSPALLTYGAAPQPQYLPGPSYVPPQNPYQGGMQQQQQHPQQAYLAPLRYQ